MVLGYYRKHEIESSIAMSVVVMMMVFTVMMMIITMMIMIMMMMMVMVMMKITMMIVMVSKPSTTKKSLQLGQDFLIRVLPMTENKRIFSLSNPFYLHVSISISQAKWCAHGSILGYRLILKT